MVSFAIPFSVISEHAAMAAASPWSPPRRSKATPLAITMHIAFTRMSMSPRDTRTARAHDRRGSLGRPVMSAMLAPLPCHIVVLEVFSTDAGHLTGRGQADEVCCVTTRT